MKKIFLTFVACGLCVPLFSVPILADDKGIDTPTINVEDPNSVMAEGYAEYNKKMISNHETYNNSLSVKVDMKDLYSTFDSMKSGFDTNLSQYGSISAFVDDEETKEIIDSLDNQTETKEIQDKLDKYKTNASGWITAKKNSKKATTKTKYKTQKAADTSYNDYSQKYDEAIASMKKQVSKEDVATSVSTYPAKIDDYQKSVEDRASGESANSNIQLTARKLSNVALNVATDTTTDFSTTTKKE